MEEDLVQGVLNLAIDIYKQVQSDDGNVVFSPFSISAALSMILAGTRGDTFKQITSALHIKTEDVHESFSKLQKSLLNSTYDITLRVANRIYADKSVKLLSAYSTLLEKRYSATLKSADFAHNAECVRQMINAWVEKTTEGKIQDLLAPGVIDLSTLLVLVNAVYFKGTWQEPFEKCETTLMDFHETSSASKKVDMMSQKGRFRMGHSRRLKASTLRKSYSGGKSSMVILLPDDVEGLKFLEENLTVDNLSSALRDARTVNDVEFYLPKFKVERDMDLKAVLQSLGIKDLFLDTADLSGITEQKNVSFTDAVHKAFADVNEEGTEAAAASAFAMARCGMPSKPSIFKVDHPFMFLIVAGDPDVVLFIGSVRRL